VALHYSQASTRGTYARGGYQTWHNSRKGWSELLMGLGLQYTFLSYEQLETGELAFPKIRVLILPYSIAMSDAELAAVRSFVEAGGTVVADQQPALMDEHCRERKTGALDDLFGIKRFDTTTGFVDGDTRRTGRHRQPRRERTHRLPELRAGEVHRPVRPGRTPADPAPGERDPARRGGPASGARRRSR
jgi:hypothetical protein